MSSLLDREAQLKVVQDAVYDSADIGHMGERGTLPGIRLRSPGGDGAWGEHARNTYIDVRFPQAAEPFEVTVREWLAPFGEGEGEEKLWWVGHAANVSELCFKLGMAVGWVKTILPIMRQERTD